MQKLILTLLFVAVIGLLLPACSKKTSTPSPENREQQRPKRDGSQQKGQRGQKPQFTDLLTRMDANKDGKLSKTEITGRLKENFSRVDGNGDGFITAEEFKTAGPPPRGGRN